MTKIKIFFKKLFAGNVENKQAYSAYKQQYKNLKKIWNSENYQDFGTERIFRLMAASLQFIFLGTLVRHLAGKKGFLERKLFVEGYVYLKVALYILLLYIQWSNIILVIICSYFILETVMYLFGLIFMNTEYSQPASYKRNTLMMIVNFFEICLAFSCIYQYYGSDFQPVINSAWDAVYFSIINATSVGFGDIAPNELPTRIFCTIQSFLSFIFSMILLGFFVSNINVGGFLNKEKQTKK